MIQHGYNAKGDINNVPKDKRKTYDPRYDYGGDAGMATEDNFNMYNQMWAKVIEIKLRDAGVTAKDVIAGGEARNKFLTRYYRASRAAAYDNNFNKGVIGYNKGDN